MACTITWPANPKATTGGRWPRSCQRGRGAAYDLRPTADGGLDYLTTDFGAGARAWYLPPGRDAKPALVGAGFGGHLYFAHNIAGSDKEHLVTGRWSDKLPNGVYHVLVHIPSTGGTTTAATYHVTSQNGTPFTAVVDQFQEQNQWVGLGDYTLGSNAAVTLNNVTGDSALESHDVAYDAVAFVPVSGTAVNHTFEAVLLFDWNQNLNTRIPSAVDTPARTMKTLHDWALDYALKGPLWSNPGTEIHGVSSFPKCKKLSANNAKCVPSDVWLVGSKWASEVKAAGTAPSKSKSR